MESDFILAAKIDELTLGAKYQTARVQALPDGQAEVQIFGI